MLRLMRFSLFLLLFSILSAYAAEPLPNAGKKQESTPKPSQSNTEEMYLDQQFKGPFADTLIQRWVDKVNGNICYIYIPVIVPNLPPPPDRRAEQQLKVYGPNSIGALSCVAGNKK